MIEAAACGMPTVASRIYGLIDAVREGETGFLHPPGDVAALAERIGRLAFDDALRQRMGGAARERAVRYFSQTRLTEALLAFYGKVLGT